MPAFDGMGTRVIDVAGMEREIAALRRELTAAQQRVAGLELTLQFYADGTHYSGDEWEDVSGEPPNWLCNPHGDTIEDGTIAKAALETPPRYVMSEADTVLAAIDAARGEG